MNLCPQLKKKPLRSFSYKGLSCERNKRENMKEYRIKKCFFQLADLYSFLDKSENEWGKKMSEI